MKILVLVKQIPDVNRVRWDPATNRIIREGVTLQMNSFDKKAVEEACRIKEKTGAEVTVLSMGPDSAKDALVVSLKMGADSAYLLSDRSLAGSDTLITAMALSAFAKKLKPDLILCGKYSLDGETSQVPPEVAVFLGYEFTSSVSRIELQDGYAEITRDLEGGTLSTKISFPAVISVSEKINKARFVRPGGPDLSDRIKVVNQEFTGTHLEGIKDSPTVVVGTENIESKRRVQFIENIGDFIRLIMEARISGDENARTIEMEDHDGSPESFVIAVDDAGTTMEIATKAVDMTHGGYRVTAIGNIPPEELKGITAHEYIRIPCRNTRKLAEHIVDLIRERSPEFVLFPSTVNGRDLASFVAASMKLGLTADCIDLRLEDRRLVQLKPAFGGGVVASIISKTTPQMATVRPGVFKAATTQRPFRFVERKCDEDISVPEVFTSVPEDFKPLNGSSIVIGIGKGLISKDNVRYAIDLANALGASLGGTRPIVDMDWLPRQQQIGLTGMSISPGLYLAIGISGQDNHVVGIRYAKKVFSVNRSRDAPIFQYSDYGLIYDSVEFIKEFIEKLQNDQ